MALSDLVVRQAKATGKAYTLPDIDGLSLAVSPAGNKSWHFRYYWLGKQQRMSLGNYPEVSLRDARSLRDEARALVAKDINPHRHRKQKRAAAKLAGKHTFDAIYKKWLAHRELSLKKGRQTTLSILPRVFAKDVLPALGKRSIYDIKRPDLLEVIAKIEKRKALSVAEKVRTWFNQLFRYALVIVPDLEQNPASDLDVVALPLPPVNHNPFLRMADLPKLLQRLRKYRGVLLSAGAGLACAAPGAAGTCCATSPCSFSTCTWPANGAGRSAASQISAGESLRNVKLCDQPASLATVAFQIALPSGVGKAMPWSCSTLNTVPRMPDRAVRVLHVQVDGDLADVVQQRRIGDAGRPGFGLGGLRLRRCAGGQQVRLPQLEGVGDDLQAVVQHAARIGMVVRFRGGELLDQLGVALQGCQVQRGELAARQ